jgi:hypothetical protein
MSFRSEPPDGQDLAEVIGRWQAVAERDVTEFVASEAYLFSLNDREWSRKDFAYTREDGSRIQGFFMAAELNNQVVIFWIEIPSDRYEQQSVEFLLSLAGLH